MKKPTKEQIKEFWKQYGIEIKDNQDGTYETIILDGTDKLQQEQVIWFSGGLLPVDLNNLFKYAVPRMWVVEISLLDGIFWSVTVSYPAPPNGVAKIGKGLAENDLALALFWALWEIKEVKNENS